MTKFRNVLILATAMFSAGIAQAQSMRENAREFKSNWREGTSTLRGLIGLNRGELDLGLDYERRMGVMGLGGFFLLSGENDSTATSAKPGQLVVGVNVPVHIIDRSPFDIYVAPGITYVKNDDVDAAPGAGIAAQESESAFGPSMRLGMIYTINDTWGVGLDFIRATNWSNEDVQSDYDFANVAVSYNM